VILGAHLDSWNPGTGAQDNGTGVATVIDAAREIQSLGHAPRQTVRFILFGGEEQGKVGSVAYAKQHRAEMDKIELLQGDATVIATTYVIANATTAFAPHLDAKSVKEMMKPTGRFEDFEYYKEHDLLP
jgi:Zn-dependent M28 family amino/carboxypeptidase